MEENFYDSQISVQKNNKVLLEFKDSVKFTDNAVNSLDKRSKIYCYAKDYSKGTGDSSTNASHNIGVYEMLTMINLFKENELSVKIARLVKPDVVLQQTNIFSEDKILDFDAYANSSNKLERKCTRISLDYNPALNNPYSITVSNGWGIPEKTSSGGTKAKSGSVRITDSIRILFTYKGLLNVLTPVELFIHDVISESRNGYLLNTKLTK